MRARTLVGVAATVWALAGAGASAAEAARVVGYSEGSSSGSYSVIIYRAEPGEANDVTVTRDEEGVLITDPGVELRAREECRRVDAHTVRCASRAAEVTVRTGDRDDRVSGGQVVRAGAGDDVVRGARDVAGGVGDDVLVGTGEERSQVTYAARREAVRVDLSDETRSGVKGEHDRVSGFLEAEGGHGDDVLLGDAGPNVLTGGDGRDRLVGRAGDDVLVMYDEGRPHGAQGWCGPGTDEVRVDATESPTQVIGPLRACEQVTSIDAAPISLPPLGAPGDPVATLTEACLDACRLRLTLRADGEEVGATRVDGQPGPVDVAVALAPAGQAALARRGRLRASLRYLARDRYGPLFVAVMVVLREPPA